VHHNSSQLQGGYQNVRLHSLQDLLLREVLVLSSSLIYFSFIAHRTSKTSLKFTPLFTSSDLVLLRCISYFKRFDRRAPSSTVRCMPHFEASLESFPLSSSLSSFSFVAFRTLSELIEEHQVQQFVACRASKRGLESFLLSFSSNLVLFRCNSYFKRVERKHQVQQFVACRTSKRSSPVCF
jgi:hypothetical protein